MIKLEMAAKPIILSNFRLKNGKEATFLKYATDPKSMTKYVITVATAAP